MPLRRPAAGHLPVVASAAVSWHQTQRCFRRDGAQIAGPDAVNATSCPAPAARSEPLRPPGHALRAQSSPERQQCGEREQKQARTRTKARSGQGHRDLGLDPSSAVTRCQPTPRRAAPAQGHFPAHSDHPADTDTPTANEEVLLPAQVPGLSALPAPAPSFAYREEAETPGYKAKGTARPCERLRGSAKSAGCRLPPRRHSSAACSLLKCLSSHVTQRR